MSNFRRLLVLATLLVTILSVTPVAAKANKVPMYGMKNEVCTVITVQNTPKAIQKAELKGFSQSASACSGASVVKYLGEAKKLAASGALPTTVTLLPANNGNSSNGNGGSDNTNNDTLNGNNGNHGDQDLNTGAGDGLNHGGKTCKGKGCDKK
jgi:hypothetical protein